ncbi:MAG: hypothetical protein M5U09_18625 [Gammaproteobacteria bacterium]|nr:hypothetical protein [Gammaproteobacteria bacterium]
MAIMLSFALALAPPAAPRWSRLPDLPIGLGGPAVRVHGRPLICVGGSYFPVSLFQGGTKKWVDEVQVLEYGAASWRSVGQLPHPLAYAGVVPNVDGPILLGGSDGQQHYRDVFRLAYNGLGVVRHDPPPLPEPIAYAAVARAGDVNYVAGGQTSPDAPTGEPRGWMLDLAADEPAWQPLPPWPGPGRMLSAAAGYRGDFYVFSGCSLAAVDGAMRRTYFADSYRFRPGEGWTELADLPRPAVAAGSPAHVHDGRIWIFGGDTGELAERIPELKEDHPGFPHTTLVYDPAADRWDELPGLPFSQLTTSLTAIEDRPVLASGEDRPGHRAPACWIADWPLDEARQFVSGGQLLAVREEGGPWAVADGYATRQGMGPILWGDGAVGSGDFTVTMQLVIDDLARSAASVCIDGRSHFGFEGAGGETFLSGPLFTKATRLVDGPWIASGKPFTLTIRREGKVTTFAVDRRPVVMVETGTGRFGTVGLRPWRATMKVAAFGSTASSPPRSHPMNNPGSTPSRSSTSWSRRSAWSSRGAPRMSTKATRRRCCCRTTRPCSRSGPPATAGPVGRSSGPTTGG